jgi:ubiquinone/menaquinone biosynthesis C-methylase UbiE
MNLKILDTLEDMFKTSPQILRDDHKLRQSIQGMFNVWVEDVSFDNTGELVNKIDDKVLEKYFSNVWQSETKKYKHSGLALVDEINSLRPRSVLDVGCGYNEFKGKIDNLIGIDPYNNHADIKVSILDFRPSETFDVVMCLGSINFGSTDKILKELERIVELTTPGGKIYFRVNPGLKHVPTESTWISFYEWTPTFIINCADFLKVDVLDLRNDYKERMYFVWSKN